MVNKVVIVGAGPTGLLLAHYLLRRDNKYQIEIYERRSDPRIVSFSTSRTFPISLNERGMNALSKIDGLAEAVKAISLSVTGGVFHQKNGKSRFSPKNKPLITLDRTKLAIVMLETLTEKYDFNRLKVYFNCQCTQVDFAGKKVRFINLETKADFTVNYDLLIGADGAASVVREYFSATEDFECVQKFVPNDYKSLFLPRPNEKVSINLKPGNIHSWMLNDGTVILLLFQQDGTVSGVIHFPHQKNQVANLATKEDVLKFFQNNFSEIGELMTEEEAEAFLNRPISRMQTIRCSRYHQGDSVLLMGDAAHAVSFFIGQGCNASLEDVAIFDNLLDQYSDDIAEALTQFTLKRKQDAHALVELGNNTFPLAKRLFFEFLLRELVAKTLYKLFPNRYVPSLSDLIFESSVPYSEILNSYKGWISKVERSNKKFLETSYKSN
ncbi:MAG: FAD-dependent monooxygenase [Fischerella sp. CENA71]|nr:FAD-dependent monooxygenase [Fischerella sp. CENA71]